MSEQTPENPPPADEGAEPTTPPAEEPGGTTPPAEEPGTEEPGGTPEGPVDETPPGEEPGTGNGGGDEPPPPVVLPPTGTEYQQGVDTLYGELTDEVNTPRWAARVDELTALVAAVYTDDVLPVAYELAGDEAESRRMARDAAASLVLTRISEALQGAEAAAELDDQPEPEPEPTPEPPAPPVEPPAEG